MKPLALEVFPWVDRWAERSIVNFRGETVKYNHREQGYDTPQGVLPCGDSKHLTDAELSAEFHQQAAYVEARTHQTTVAHDQRNRDRLDTLRRFATLPDYDQETP